MLVEKIDPGRRDPSPFDRGLPLYFGSDDLQKPFAFRSVGRFGVDSGSSAKKPGAVPGFEDRLLAGNRQGIA